MSAAARLRMAGRMGNLAPLKRLPLRHGALALRIVSGFDLAGSRFSGRPESISAGGLDEIFVAN
jgi:hypothetical protein